MPGLDPSIPLGVLGANAGGQGGPSTNGALGLASQYAGIQNQLNQNRLFQQTFMAKQRAGEILATAPDTETGMANLLKDPEVAPFAGTIINEYKQGMLATTQLQGEQAKQNQSALDAVLKASAAGLADPSQLKGAIQTQMAAVPDAIRSRVMPAVQTWVKSLTDGLPSDPVQARAVYANRLAAHNLANGITPDVIQGIVGKPTMQEGGGQILPGVQLPAQLGGGFQPSGAPIQKTLAPEVKTFKGPQGQDVPTMLGGAYGMPGGGGGGVSPVPPGPSSTMAGLLPSAPAQGTATTPQGLPIGPGVGQSKYLEERAHDMADYQKTLDDKVRDGAELMRVVDATRQAASMITTGGGAGVRDKFGGLLQGLGASQDLVDRVANGDKAASTEVNKLMVNSTLSQIRQQLPQGSRVAVTEFNEFTKNNPNLSTDPRAMDKIFSFWTRAYNQTSDEQRTLAEESQKPGFDMSRWPTQWNQILKDRGYIHPSETLNVGDSNDYKGKTADDLRSDVASGKIAPGAAMQIGTHLWGADRTKWPRSAAGGN